MATNFFSKFPNIQYDISGKGNYVTLTDISRTVDINNLNEDKVSYYTYYNIQNGDRPDIISQKLYGNPNYYWTFFILNDQLKTGISNSWPLSSVALEQMISDEYDEYSALIINPELTFQNKLAEGHGDFSVIPLDSQYLTSLKIIDINGIYKANILKYDYALLQLVVHNIVEISTGKTSSAIKNAFLNSEQFKLIWENAYEAKPVAASLLTGDSISNNQIKYTARQIGTDGNNISITYYNQGETLNQESVDVNVAGNAITVGPPAAKARMIVNGAGFAGVNGTYIYNGLVTLGGASTKQWKLDNGWPSIPSAPKVTISFVGSFGSWSIYYNDVTYYISEAVYYANQPNPENAVYMTYNNSPSPVPTVTAGISTAAQVIAAVNATSAAANLVTASANGTVTGAIVEMNQTFLLGGVDNVPTDFALYDANVTNKEKWIDRVISQYDKIDGVNNGIIGSAYDRIGSAVNGITKNEYVFDKTYFKTPFLENSSWEYYKYAPYQYFKLDKFDSSVTYPESIFSVIDKVAMSDTIYISGNTNPNISGELKYVMTSDGQNGLWCNADTEWVDAWYDGEIPISSYNVIVLFYTINQWTLFVFEANTNNQIFIAHSEYTSNSTSPLNLTYTTYSQTIETCTIDSPPVCTTTTIKYGEGTAIISKKLNPNSISYYEKEQLQNDSKQKIKVVRPDLIRNFEKIYFSVLTS